MRVEFGNADAMGTWLTQAVNPDKYDLYYMARSNELVAVKNVSTPPRVYAYVRDTSEQEAQKLHEDSGSASFIRALDFEWSAEQRESSV